MSPLLTGQEVRAAGVSWEPRCVHSLPPTPRTHRITITNFCLGKHLVSEGDLLKDQRGSPAYISPDVLSGRCGAQAVGPGQHTAGAGAIRSFRKPYLWASWWLQPVLSLGPHGGGRQRWPHQSTFSYSLRLVLGREDFCACK